MPLADHLPGLALATTSPIRPSPRHFDAKGCNGGPAQDGANLAAPYGQRKALTASIHTPSSAQLSDQTARCLSHYPTRRPVSPSTRVDAAERTCSAHAS